MTLSVIVTSPYSLKPTLANNKTRCRRRILAIGEVSDEGTLACADDVLVVANRVDLGGGDGADRLAAVWVTEDDDCEREKLVSMTSIRRRNGAEAPFGDSWAMREG